LGRDGYEWMLAAVVVSSDEHEAAKMIIMESEKGGTQVQRKGKGKDTR
jgi:hypothetical protein